MKLASLLLIILFTLLFTVYILKLEFAFIKLYRIRLVQRVYYLYLKGQEVFRETMFNLLSPKTAQLQKMSLLQNINKRWLTNLCYFLLYSRLNIVFAFIYSFYNKFTIHVELKLTAIYYLIKDHFCLEENAMEELVLSPT